MQYRNFLTVLTEAVFIGALTVVLYLILNNLGLKNMYVKLFLIGALAHIIFEYLGLNEKWCKTVYNL